MIKVLTQEGAQLPAYGSLFASGMDVSANSILKVYRGDREIDPEQLLKVQKGFEERGYIKLRSLERIIFGTGLNFVLPLNLELQVRSRSGLSSKRGLTVLNSPGTIDADYRGEVGIIMYNTTPFLNKISKGERIAQLVVAEVQRPSIKEISLEEFQAEPESERGAEGFGSTGQN